MAIEVFKLFGSIMVKNDEANKNISKTEEKAEGLGKKLIGGIGTAAKWGAAVAAAAGTAATARIPYGAALLPGAAHLRAARARTERRALL